MLHSNGGEINDRTAVQKIAYFANLRLRIEGVGYKDYFYGPFSRGLAIALDNLVSSLFVRETVRATPIEQYSYGLTGDGEDLAASVVAESPAEHGTVRSVVGACKRHCSLSARPLSCAAKVHFILEAEPGRTASQRDMRCLARGFGWRMTCSEIERGMSLLGELAPTRAAVQGPRPGAGCAGRSGPQGRPAAGPA